MGQTLSSAANWTSAKDGAKPKLECTTVNEEILNSVAKFVDDYPRDNPDGAKLVFKTALSWETSLTPNDVSSLTDEQTKDGQPLVSIKGKSTYTISVMTFEKCQQILAVSGENKIAETRACLEANNDPIPKMFGDRFAMVQGSDNALFRYMEEVSSAGQSGQQEESQDDDDTQEKKNILKMLLAINKFDSEMLHNAVKEISKHVKLSADSVDRVVNSLKKYCGDDDDKYPLENIDWTIPYTYEFSNQCRAPHWRQVYGDISYITAVPHDVEPLSITACTQGYFINKGMNKEKNELDYENVSEGQYYKELNELLREKSAKFGELYDKLDYFSVRDDTTKGGVVDTTADLDREYGQEDRERGEETQRSKKGGAQQSQDDEDKKKKDQRKKEQQKQKKMEPSLKWKNLEIEEQKKSQQKDEKKEKEKKKKSKRCDSKTNKPHSASDGESSFEESSSESEEEEEAPDRRNDTSTDLPSEYWQIQKLVKYLKAGNQTATIIALCCMRDFNLQQETCQLAIRDVGGLEVLINLLDTAEIKCKIGALKILKEISRNLQIRRAIADLGGLQTMVKILRDCNKELKCLAAETIANVAKFRRARRTVRQHGGIKKLVALLDCAAIGTNAKMTAEQEKDVEVARSGALALWSCSKSTRNKQSMRKAGAIPLLAKLLKSPHENMLIPVVGTLQECATEPSYRLAIRTEGMIEDLVKNLQSENEELQMHCASAIFKCAEEKETRDLVRRYGGLDPEVKLLNNTENKELLAAGTGAIWKCAISPENVVRFQELKAIDLLVNLLNDQPEEVLVNVVGALAELAKDPPNRLTIRKAGGIPPLVNLLTGTNQALLVNVTKAVGQCAEEPDNMVVIDKLDGVRLLWSLLKNPNPEVQASAAWAICPCIENAKDAGEMVRSFVGGLELIVGLLNTTDKDVSQPEVREVLASVCAAIANIANDEENLAVITDHGVVPLLAKLTNIPDDRLRRHLAEAIARCCNWGNNRVSFGEEKAVAPLVKYLKTQDVAVHRSTARGLHQLSKDPDNCITMHEAGVVKPLMEMVGSEDDVLQEAAAGCIANIRRLALANEKSKHK